MEKGAEITTVREHLEATDAAICRNIDALTDQRGLLSQNVLAQLRNLVEGVAVRLQVGAPDVKYDYPTIKRGLAFVKGKGQYRFLSRFHGLLKVSASHYTLDGDASERLMLKYYEYLFRIRALLRDECGTAVLANLESFPVDLDPTLRDYYEKIAMRIETVRSGSESGETQGRYYIRNTRPFFVGGRVYYEVTFYPAVNRVSKFDRLIAFTSIDMTDRYSAMLTLQRESIDVLDHTMPIMIIRSWEVSIRPCEFDNFARLLGIALEVRTNSTEYRYLMNGLTAGLGSLLDLIDMPDDEYAEAKSLGTAGVAKPLIFPLLDRVRGIVRAEEPGHNVLRYLLLRMSNQVLKLQYGQDDCGRLSNLRLSFGCIPFDTMPFCTSLPGHNPRYWDLIESLDVAGRNHELLARRVKNNVERHGILYTPVSELKELGDIQELISKFNSKLYLPKHSGRRLVLDKEHVFIVGYEDDIVAIVERLQDSAESGKDGYASAVDRWIRATPGRIDDESKQDVLKSLFCQSKVALIYGAAGTGKSTMVGHIADYFGDATKLFLAHTNPAIDSLRRKVTAQNSTFRTITSHLQRSVGEPVYDLLVVDECSTVGNADLIKVLEQTSFELLVLVGDVYQIESIQFGNWFSVIRSFIPDASVFELTNPFRTKRESLLDFWGKVRCIDDDIAEVMVRNGYSNALDRTLFDVPGADEIILCLNYDGLYGINNINRFLQSVNPSAAVNWRVATYKIGDPVLFNETERFWPVIHNNLKGWIVGVDCFDDRIQFDIKLDRTLSERDIIGEELEWLEGSVVRFSVYDRDSSDEDDDSSNTTVPFQVAYAVSIHKAQGLEYDSVKIIITEANEDDVTHSIFYTAVTRAREQLKVFWTPATQQTVLKRLRRNGSHKDISLLSSRRGLGPLPERAHFC